MTALKKVKYSSEEEARKFQEKARTGHRLIKRFNSLDNDTTLTNEEKAKQRIEIQNKLRDIDDWMEKSI